MTHLCPCGCGAQVGNALYSCRPSWFRLPVELRNEIHRTNRRGVPIQQRSRALAQARQWFKDNAEVQP